MSNDKPQSLQMPSMVGRRVEVVSDYLLAGKPHIMTLLQVNDHNCMLRSEDPYIGVMIIEVGEIDSITVVD